MRRGTVARLGRVTVLRHLRRPGASDARPPPGSSPGPLLEGPRPARFARVLATALALGAGSAGPGAALAQDAPGTGPGGQDGSDAWPIDDGPPLRALAARHGVRIGHAMRFDWPSLQRADRYEAIVAREFDLVTPESSMKWDPLRPALDEYDFRDLDRLAAFARTHDIELHGHPLVWHRLNPDWVDELPAGELAEAMISHIETLMTRWPGLYPVWDVVNEAVADGGDGLRESPFLDAMGPAYLDVAHRAARAADPDATLIYNDYDIGWPTPKGAAAFALLDDLSARGVPVDAIGFQMHLDLDFAHAEGFSRTMQDAADRGLDVYVTEFDVTVPDVADFDAQGQLYEDVLERCLMQPACRAFQVWGLDDRFSFRPQFDPLPFDDELEPKPAFYAMRRALAAEPVHPELCTLDGLVVASGAVSPGGDAAAGATPGATALARCDGVRLGPGYAELAVRYSDPGGAGATLEVRVAGTGEPVASVALPATSETVDGAFDTLRVDTVSMPTGDVALELELVGADAGVALDALLFDAPAGPVVEGFGTGLTGPGTGTPGGAGVARAAIGGGGAQAGAAGGGEPVPDEGAGGTAGGPDGSGGEGSGGGRSGGGGVPGWSWLALGCLALARRARSLHRCGVTPSHSVPPCAPRVTVPSAGARPPPA